MIVTGLDSYDSGGVHEVAMIEDTMNWCRVHGEAINSTRRCKRGLMDLVYLVLLKMTESCLLRSIYKEGRTNYTIGSRDPGD